MKILLNIISDYINVTLIFCGGFSDSLKQHAQKCAYPVLINVFLR
jgi:hypothetical protein